MRKLVFYCLLCLIFRYSTQAQIFYSINNYSGDFSTETLWVSSSIGDFAAGSLVSESMEVLNTYVELGAQKTLGVPGIFDETLIYPNPASDRLIIKSGKIIDGEVMILNLKGELLIYKTLSQVTEIDISGLYPGVYIVKIASEDGHSTSTMKLLKN